MYSMLIPFCGDCVSVRVSVRTYMHVCDTLLLQCSKKEAINYNFGGSEEGGIIRSCTSAYMLVYVRDSHLRTLSGALVREFCVLTVFDTLQLSHNTCTVDEYV